MNDQLATLQKITRSASGEPCRVSRLIANLEEPYRSAAQQLVDVTHNQGGLADIPLAAEFRKAGIQLSSTMINRHRNGWCPCPTEKGAAID